jgi:uncharacterized protein YjbI with pentapeptide repeats
MGTPGAHDQTYLQQWIDNIAFWRWLKRWRQEHPTNLFTASMLTIAVLVVFGGALWFGLAWVLASKLPWDLDNTGTTEFSVLRMVLFILAGAVGVVGVVVAYRRQQNAEQGRFLEQLAEASRLLGDPNPTIQAAGIYALAGLADTEGHARRQQCVDVLCAYIRLPYAPAPKGQEPQTLENITQTRTLDTQTGPVEEQRVLFRPHDRHTRETIIRVITQHLRPKATVSWSDLDLDFTGAFFDYGDFTWAVFAGTVDFRGAEFASGTVDFRGAEFASGTIDFTHARFTGGTVDFSGAEFTGGNINFTHARFTGGTVDFRGAEFTGGNINFTHAKFTGGTINFWDAGFAGGNINFADATFIGGSIKFTRAKLTDGTINFWDAGFINGTIEFMGAKLIGGTINFTEAKLIGGTINFTGAKLTGCIVDFTRADLTVGTIKFEGAKLAGGTINFTRAISTGGTVNFRGAEFAGGTVNFRGAEFAGGTVNFNQPYEWTAPRQVPWADTWKPPIGVLPREWPPTPDETAREAAGGDAAKP